MTSVRHSIRSAGSAISRRRSQFKLAVALIAIGDRAPTGQGRPRLGRTGPVRAGSGRSGQVRASSGKFGQVWTGLASGGGTGWARKGEKFLTRVYDRYGTPASGAGNSVNRITLEADAVDRRCSAPCVSEITPLPLVMNLIGSTPQSN